MSGIIVYMVEITAALYLSNGSIPECCCCVKILNVFCQK